ncbi:MAG: hypothetical protein AAF638_12680 [Pseudomonadota bacterium]
MRILTSSRSLLAGAVLLMISGGPGLADPITELEPFLAPDETAEGTPLGGGAYADVVITEAGERVVTAARLEIEIDGAILRNLKIDSLTLLESGDNPGGAIARVTVRDADIPLDLDLEDEKAVFGYFLSANAAEMSIEGAAFADEDATVTLDKLAATELVDGRFGLVQMSGLAITAVEGDDPPVTVNMADFRLGGMGVGIALFAHAMAEDGVTMQPGGLPFGTPQPDMADASFLDGFSLKGHEDHMRFEEVVFAGVTVAIDGNEVMRIDDFAQKVTAFSGDMPAAATTALSGSFNLDTIAALSSDDPRAGATIGAVRSLLGRPDVRFEGGGTTNWAPSSGTLTSMDGGVTIDGILRIAGDQVVTGYDPARMLEAAVDPNDALTARSAMEGAVFEDIAIRLTDLGGLDIAFAILPPSIDRGQIAMQAAQFAGLAAMQVLQTGMTLNGNLPEIASAFIQSGGTLEIALSDGVRLPMDILLTLSETADADALIGLASKLSLDISHTP